MRIASIGIMSSADSTSKLVACSPSVFPSLNMCLNHNISAGLQLNRMDAASYVLLLLLAVYYSDLPSSEGPVESPLEAGGDDGRRIPVEQRRICHSLSEALEGHPHAAAISVLLSLQYRTHTVSQDVLLHYRLQFNTT